MPQGPNTTLALSTARVAMAGTAAGEGASNATDAADPTDGNGSSNGGSSSIRTTRLDEALWGPLVVSLSQRAGGDVGVCVNGRPAVLASLVSGRERAACDD